MMNDPMNNEILRINREFASQFVNNLNRFVADIKSRERDTVTLEPRVSHSQTGRIPQLQNKSVPKDLSATVSG